MNPRKFLELLKARRGTQDGPVDIEQMRQELDQLGRKAPMEDGTLAHETGLDGIPCIRFDPDTDTNVHVLYFHGGGYCVGSPQSHAMLTSAFAKITTAHVWSVDYGMAPERPSPAALDDALRAYQALLKHVDSPEHVFVAGDSAGGGLAVALAMRAKELKLSPPAGLVLMSPWVDLTLSGWTHTACKDRDHLVWRSMLEHLGGLYADDTDKTDPRISPLFGDLNGLPDMLIHAGSEEVLLSDSTELAGRAGCAGVAVELKIWPDMPHVFQAYTAVLDESRQSLADISHWMGQRMPA